MKTISKNDKIVLRELAKKQLEFANSPKNRELEKEWIAHNTFKGNRPMIHVEMWTFENEIIPPLLKCESSTAREFEANLYRQFLNQELLEDDRPIPDYFPVQWKTWFNLFGIEAKRTTSTLSNLGYHVDAEINDLEEDFYKIGKSTFGVDKVASLEEETFANDVFGDILPAKRVSSSIYACPTQMIVLLMGMENMLISMMDYPELFIKMMRQVADDFLASCHFLEDEGFLNPTTGAESLGQGSFCYTDELPSEKTVGVPFSTSQMWGYLDAQECVSISPQMFGEVIFPCYEKIADIFGAISFGCCEPVHPIWDYISTLPNLKKVSISPWCDEEYMAEQLRGKNIVFHRKPSPNFLGVGTVLDEEAIRKHFRKTLRIAKGCTLEFAQRDVYTVNNNANKAKRYVQILREEITNNWR